MLYDLNSPKTSEEDPFLHGILVSLDIFKKTVGLHMAKNTLCGMFILESLLRFEGQLWTPLPQ